jgi:outer membrane protein assembly factor BamD (BamD/ComL family)
VKTAPFLLRGALTALLAVSGCATSGGAGHGFDGRAKQADDKLPVAARFYDEAQRKLVEQAQELQAAARKLVEEGNVDRARGAFGAAADQFSRYVEAYPTSEWRIPFRFRAAEYYLFAQAHRKAADQADAILADSGANGTSRALAAQLSAVAWRWVAVQAVKAGQLEAMKLATVDQRGDRPLAPHPPAEPWARFVAAVDAFVPLWEKHPDAARAASDRNGALTPWQATLVAAEVEYSCDDMAGAARRLDSLLSTWPGELDVVESAVPLLLQTYLLRGDPAGFGVAAERAKKLLEAQAGRAAEARVREGYVKLRDQVARLQQVRAFAEAAKLMAAGKAAEAAAAFERFAAENAAAADAAAALFNAAQAWDAAGMVEKATASREALIASHPDSKMAPNAALFLASAASKRQDHAAAARYYGTYVERWPDGASRCLALQNASVEVDLQGDKAAAAERYLAFGTDARCAKERPDDAAKALYRSGKLLIDAKQPSRAKEAFEAVTRVEGVTDPTALRQIEDAKRQIKRL